MTAFDLGRWFEALFVDWNRDNRDGNCVRRIVLFDSVRFPSKASNRNWALMTAINATSCTFRSYCGRRRCRLASQNESGMRGLIASGQVNLILIALVLWFLKIETKKLGLDSVHPCQRMSGNTKLSMAKMWLYLWLANRWLYFTLTLWLLPDMWFKAGWRSGGGHRRRCPGRDANSCGLIGRPILHRRLIRHKPSQIPFTLMARWNQSLSIWDSTKDYLSPPWKWLTYLSPWAK